MAISYFATASNPADNTATNAEPISVTPPANMQAGDLVVVALGARQQNVSLTVSNTGGQTWASFLAHAWLVTEGYTWCIFNGTWTSDPSFSTTISLNGAVMHVFRSDVGGATWEVDVSGDFAAHDAPVSPFTITVPGQTTLSDSTVTIGGICTNDNNSWTNLQGTGWVETGGAQYRNTQGNDLCWTFAHKIQTAAGATGSWSKDQTVVTGGGGSSFIVTFKEVGGASGTTHEGSVSETLTISQTDARILSSTPAVSESMTLSDTGARILNAQKSLSESLTITDVNLRIVDSSQSVSESLSVTDEALRGVNIDESIAESVSLSDTLNRVVDSQKAVTESITLTDSFTKVANLLMSVLESVTLSDSLTKIADMQMSVAESVSITDAVVQGANIAVSFDEAFTLSDSSTRGLTISGSVSESLAVTDSDNRIAALARMITQALSLTESIQANAVLNVSNAEDIALLESLSADINSTLIGLIAEGIAVVDVFSGTIVGHEIRRIISLVSSTTTTVTGGKGGSTITGGQGTRRIQE